MVKKISFRIILFLSLLITACKSGHRKTIHPNNATAGETWWKNAIVYQVYPRSFKDSDGDGVGDLKGIISKMDYLKSLGIDVIWLNPVYSSPNDDNGYDISDYRNIMKEFGSIEDFEVLLNGLHERGIRLVMDLVVNHSSDEHEWFKQSRSARNNPYREYYHWWNADRGKPAPRYSLFDVNHDAWMYDSVTNAYYLHYFSRKQPDLNWENPKVRQEVYDIMKFWADKGIDGFRLDAFQFVAKDTTFPAFPRNYEKNFIQYYAMGSHLHDYLQEMNREVLSKYNMMSVAEGAGRSFEDAHDLVDANRNELNIAYAFDAVDIAKRNGYSLVHLKEIFTRWDSAFAENGWLSIFLANHDQARLVSRFGNDSPAFRRASSTMLNTFLLSMRGTPFTYYGDELGMTNPGFTKIEDYKDVAILNEYRHLKKTGGNLKDYMLDVQFGGRDNGRTPMQWNDSTNAGFSNGKPWLRVNPDYSAINVSAEEKDTNSCLNYFKKMVRLRKENPVLVYGKYTLLDKNNPDVYAYSREWKGKKILVLLNFSARKATAVINENINTANVLISNYNKTKAGTELDPYEAMIVQLSE